MEFYKLCTEGKEFYLSNRADWENCTTKTKVGYILKEFKEKYQQESKTYQHSFIACMYDLVLGGMNLNNYRQDGTRKKYKTIVTSLKDEPIMFDVVYEDDPRYETAVFKIP